MYYKGRTAHSLVVTLVAAILCRLVARRPQELLSVEQLEAEIAQRHGGVADVPREASEKRDPGVTTVIVWGADLAGKPVPGLHCMVRYGGPTKTWDHMLRGTGRVSNTSGETTTKPRWDMGLFVLGGEETTIIFRVVQANGDFLPATANVSTLLAAQERSESDRFTLSLRGVGHLQLSAHRGQVLHEHGLSASAGYESLQPIAPQRAVRVEDITGEGPLWVGRAPLPKSLQGLWWLTGQRSSSALVTFGGPNNDGDGCSNGYLKGDKHTYTIRTEGDRVFTTAQASAIDRLAEGFDMMYYFEFNDAVEPTLGQIYVHSGLGIGLSGQFSQHLLNFQMHLYPHSLPEFPGSLVWLRNSSVLHFNAGEDYNLVQVMDGSGKRLEPAWSKFVRYQNSSITGDFPGWIFYKSLEPSPSPGSEEVVQRLQEGIRARIFWGVIIGVVAVAVLVGAGVAYYVLNMQNQPLRAA